MLTSAECRERAEQKIAEAELHPCHERKLRTRQSFILGRGKPSRAQSGVPVKGRSGRRGPDQCGDLPVLGQARGRTSCTRLIHAGARQSHGRSLPHHLDRSCRLRAQHCSFLGAPEDRVPNPAIHLMRDREAISRCTVAYHRPSRALRTIGRIYQRQARRESTASARMAPSVNDVAAVEVAT
jgi:hypothetical protein